DPPRLRPLVGGDNAKGPPTTPLDHRLETRLRSRLPLGPPATGSECPAFGRPSAFPAARHLRDWIPDDTDAKDRRDRCHVATEGQDDVGFALNQLDGKIALPAL